MDSNREVVTVKAFSVKNIITDKIGRDQVNFNPKDFPRLSKEVLQEAGKPLPRKYLDVLEGNPDLALQPVCKTGFGCKDYAKGFCLYRSSFGSLYVPLGYFGKDKSLVNSVKHIALKPELLHLSIKLSVSP